MHCIALLRAINVGGNSNIRMAELRKLGESLGFSGVKTLLGKQPGAQGSLETIPFISSRMVSIDGVSVEDLKVKNYQFQAIDRAIIETILNRDTAKHI